MYCVMIERKKSFTKKKKQQRQKLKAKPKPMKDIYPTSHVFTIIARGMGKKSFLMEILNSFLKEKVIKCSNIMISYIQ